MRQFFGITLVSIIGMVLMSGCGVSPTTFESNDTAVEMLGGTTWGDPGGNVSITFDENAKITSFSVPNLPPELANVRIDGEPFTIRIPDDVLPPELSAFAGKEFTATLENTLTTVNPDGTMQIEFLGTVSIPFVNGITLVIDTTAQTVGGNTSLSGLSGSLIAHTIAGDFNVFSGDFADNIPIVQLN